MGDRFKKVQAGQELQVSAEVWNTLIDLTRKHKDGKHPQGAKSEPIFQQSNLAKVRNQTGLDLDQFSVVGLASPIILPTDNALEFKRQVTFNGTLPSNTSAGRFGVTIQPIAAGAIGLAAIAGIVAVKLAVDGVPFACACPMDGQTGLLKAVPHGPVSVLWMESTGAIRWSIIRFDDSNYEEIVFITSNIPDSDGYYPGIVQRYDTITKSWVSLFECKVLDANR
jgi:hypothetical protein